MVGVVGEDDPLLTVEEDEDEGGEGDGDIDGKVFSSPPSPLCPTPSLTRN